MAQAPARTYKYDVDTDRGTFELETDRPITSQAEMQRIVNEQMRSLPPSATGVQGMRSSSTPGVTFSAKDIGAPKPPSQGGLGELLNRPDPAGTGMTVGDVVGTLAPVATGIGGSLIGGNLGRQAAQQTGRGFLKRALPIAGEIAGGAVGTGAGDATVAGFRGTDPVEAGLWGMAYGGGADIVGQAGRGFLRKAAAPFKEYFDPTIESLGQRFKIPMHPDETAPNATLSFLTKKAKDSYGGANIMDRAGREQADAIQQALNTQLQQMGGPLDLVDYGQMMKGEAKRTNLGLKKQGGQHYKQVDEMAKQVGVQLPPAELDAIGQRIERELASNPQMYAGKEGRLAEIAKDFTGAAQPTTTTSPILGPGGQPITTTTPPAPLSWRDTSTLYRKLNELLAPFDRRNYQTTWSPTGMQSVHSDLRDMLEKGAAQDQALGPANLPTMFERANTFWRDRVVPFREDVAKAITPRTTKPDQVLGKVMTPNKPYMPGMVAQEMPNTTEATARAWLTEALTVKGGGVTQEGIVRTQNLTQKYAQLGEDVKNQIFGPHKQDVDDLMKTLRATHHADRYAANPSGSGSYGLRMVQAGAALDAPFRAIRGDLARLGFDAAVLFTPAIFAKIVTSPGGAKWLTKGLTVPAGTKEAATVAAQIVARIGAGNPSDPPPVAPDLDRFLQGGRQ